MDYDEIVERMLVPPGKSVKLKDFDPDWLLTKEMESLGKERAKEQSESLLEQSRRGLIEAQDLLYASDTYAVLIELQGLDAAGKDGVIKHAMSGVNPQGCEVHPFKQPTPEEKAHDFLWRYRKCTPVRRNIVIFNRSYYEDVIVVRVHPDMLPAALGEPDRSFWEHRFEAINALEHLLVRERTVVLKFFLHISKEEQRKRLLKRLKDPTKHWKFSRSDLAERSFWDEYTEAYEDALAATSTKKAPWYVVPSDHKWVARTAVAAITTHAIRSLDLKFPEPTPEQLAAIAAARARLENEKE
jgi:PPK2 family polyphosphate:nucleotide phosphotransferase